MIPTGGAHRRACDPVSNAKRQPSPSAPLTVAIHEAAHAVAAHVFGLPVAWVTIVPSPAFQGNCQLARHLMEGEAAAVIVQALAGPEAERALLGVDEPHTYTSDAAEAEEALAQVIAKTGLPFTVDIFRRRARQLVLKHRRAIENLAGLLLVCKTLDGVTVHRSIAHSLSGKFP